MAVEDKQGWVYVVNFGDNTTFKIGFTCSEPEHRLRDIQRSNVVMPNVMSLVMTSFVDQPFYLERILHSKLSQKNVRGEWFNLSFPDLVDVYKALYSIGNQVDLYDNWFDIVPKDYQEYINHGAINLDLPLLFFTKKDKEKFNKEVSKAFSTMERKQNV